MRLIERIDSDRCIASTEHAFIPANEVLRDLVDNIHLEDKEAVRAVAETAVSIAGLEGALITGNGQDDFVPKPHERVAARDAAVAEQFPHADVALYGFCGILIVGISGDKDTVPATQLVRNAPALEHVYRTVAGGPLQDRLTDIVVVRPYLDPDNRYDCAWMDYPRHVLQKLAQEEFRQFLTPAQLEHVDRACADLPEYEEYTDDVFISELVSDSVITEEPILACGVGSREIRLSLPGGSNPEETVALQALHKEITRYLLSEAEHESHKVVEGSALFIPRNQLHKAAPYNPSQHHRDVTGVRLYAGVLESVPSSWHPYSGLNY